MNRSYYHFFYFHEIKFFLKELFPGMFIKIISSENEDKVIGTIVIFHTGNQLLYE